MAEQNDPVLFAAVERWWQVNREPLVARGVVTSLLGPRDEPGMDPVYILRLASERAEAQVSLFRDGLLLRSRFDKRTATVSHAGPVPSARRKLSRAKLAASQAQRLTGSKTRFPGSFSDCVAIARHVDLIMAIYDVFAPHYDAATGDPSTEIAFIESIIKHAHLQPVTLLEVACGTGGIIASLAGSYQMAGLDISPGMLAVARRKLPGGIPLYEADMSSFALNAKFDAVICVYHGINHLLSFSDWERFFECAYRHLNDGGVLAFDIFTIDDLKIVASSPETVQQFGENYVRMRVQASAEAVFDWNIELELQGNGRHELLTEVIRTATFPPEKIREALSERFVDIQIFETNSAINESGTRIWFACIKPRSTV